MSQNIALTISLGGTQKAVSNIQQLETAIAEAKNELKGLEIGSAAFNKLATDVKVADQRLKDLNKSIEGKDLEARIGDFGKLGGAVGASFASATAAIQLFGDESEDSLKAVTQAQAALTLALGAKAAAEGAYVVKQYASIAATELQTIVTNALNASTRAFFATLLANPLTLILAGFTALVTAMYAFGDSAEEASDQVSDLNKETKDLAVLQTNALKSTIAETSQLEKFQAIVNDTNQSLRVRKAAYEELKKLVPTLQKLTFEQAQAENAMNKAIADQIQLIQLRAEAKALEELFNKEAEKSLEERRKKIERDIIQRQVERAAEIERIKSTNTNIEFINREIAAYDERTAAIRRQFDPAKRYKEITVQILDLQGKQTETINAQTTAIDANTKAEQERLRLLQVKINLEVEEQRLANQIATIQIGALTTAQGFTNEETKILPILRQRLETQKALIATNKERLTQDEKILKFAEENQGILDKAFGIFVNYTRSTQDFIKQVKDGNPDLDQMNKILNNITNNAIVASRELAEFITPEGIQNFENYVSNQKILAQSLFDIAKYGQGVKNAFNDYLQVTQDLNNENLTYEQRAQKLVELEEQRRLFVTLFVKQYTGFSQEQIKGTETLTEKQKEQLKGAQDLANVYLTNLPKINEEINKFENGVSGVNVEANKLNDNLRKGFPEALKAFFKQNTQEIIGNLQELIGQTQMVLGAFQQTVSAFYNQQFDLLEKRNKRIQEGIIGDSEEAAKKRIEAEKSYQAERKRLEKAAAKTQLQISLAQSLANTAEAITRVFAQTGIGGIIAGSLVAAASGAQTVIIAQQLAAIDSYKRGGIMRKQGGGFVTGPAHEFGGVKFQGGGVELEGNEAVINRVSTINYMGLLDQINQAGGGRPISSLANESRLIEAIAKQRNTPIRAYVVESDITAKQETARRLERLSQF